MPLEDTLEKNFQAVPQFWDKALENGTLSKFMSFEKDVFNGLLGISCVYGNSNEWKYYIAVVT